MCQGRVLSGRSWHPFSSMASFFCLEIGCLHSTSGLRCLPTEGVEAYTIRPGGWEIGPVFDESSPGTGSAVGSVPCTRWWFHDHYRQSCPPQDFSEGRRRHG